MALTLEQLSGLADDPSLKSRVTGAALAATTVIRGQDPKSTDQAAKMKMEKKIRSSPLTSSPDILAMSRMVLSEWYNTAKLSWNASPDPGQSNLVITCTDAELIALLVANWSANAAE